MGYIIFTNGTKKFSCWVERFKNIVVLHFKDDIPSKSTMRGFTWHYSDISEPCDYTEFSTVYRYDSAAGIYQMSDDGSVYVAPEPVPEPHEPTETELRIVELQQIMADNKSLLAESDYKVIKNSEYAEAGLSAAYDPTGVNAERQDYRDAINAAEVELATLTGGADDAG